MTQEITGRQGESHPRGGIRGQPCVRIVSPSFGGCSFLQGRGSPGLRRCPAEPLECQAPEVRPGQGGTTRDPGQHTAPESGPTAVTPPLQAPHHVKPPGQLQVILIPDHLKEIQMPRWDRGIEEVDITARSALAEGYSPFKPLK